MSDTGPVLCPVFSHRKIVFETAAAAWGCARELAKVFPDAGLRYAHRCGDHWHTTKRKHKEEEP